MTLVSSPRGQHSQRVHVGRPRKALSPGREPDPILARRPLRLRRTFRTR